MKGLEAFENIRIQIRYPKGKRPERSKEELLSDLNIVEKELKEKEKQTQILKVLKKCFGELDLINEARDYKQYCYWFEVRCGTPTLTKTEFNLIKEWLK